MPVPLGVKPGHSFNEPLGLLSDCHRRIEQFLDLLVKVNEEAGEEELSPAHREALQVALRYFSVAAPKHTQDVEASLFPRLRDVNSPDAREAMAKLDALEADHVRADAAHAEVDVLGLRWLQDGRLDSEKRQRLRQLLNELRELYRGHIEIEDRDVFPLAARVLTREQVDQVGKEMAQRRGLPSSPSPLG
jgi:hemerythrin-like domain-containing protein